MLAGGGSNFPNMNRKPAAEKIASLRNALTVVHENLIVIGYSDGSTMARADLLNHAIAVIRDALRETK